MSRAVFIIRSEEIRSHAMEVLRKSPYETEVQFKRNKRTLPQNSALWAALTDVSTQLLHKGERYTTDQWKVLFLHACGQEVQFLPALEGAVGVVPYGQSSSDLTVAEMDDLLEFVHAYGAQHGVVFHAPKRYDQP